MTSSLDLIVVGGGPAGLATAIETASAGMRVQVWEPRSAPIDKACGEGLMPSALVRLAALGMNDDLGSPFYGIRYVAATGGDGGDGRGVGSDASATTAEARFRHGFGAGVRRTELHEAMHRRALEVGVEFVEAAARSIEQTPREVVVDGVSARYVVGADGLHSTVRRAAGIAATSPGAPRFGLRRHYEITPWSDFVEVHWSATSEAYLTPVAPNLLGVALLTSRRGAYDDQLAAFPHLHERLANAHHGATLGSGPLRQHVTRRTQGRIALVGDAAGYVDALTGEGINVGLAGAHELAQCLIHDRLDDYEARWRATSRRYRVMTHGLLWARSRPALARRLVPAAAAWPAGFSMAVQQLS